MATIKSPTKLASVSTGGGGFSRLLRMLMMLLILLIVIAAAIGGTWFYLHWKSNPDLNPVQLGVGQSGQPGQPAPVTFTAPPATPPMQPTVVASPIFIPLEPATVMIEDKDSERLMHVAITLRVNDEQTRTRIEKYMPEVRSRVLMVLSTQSPQTVRTVEGRTEMSKAIAQALSRPFSPLPDGQIISDVLFTEFVVQ